MRNLFKAIPLLCTLMVATPASANKITKLDIWAPEGYADAPTIRVYSTNGEKWNAVDDTVEARFKVRLNAKCRFEGRGNKAYEGDLQIPGFEIIGDTEPAHFLIPHADTAEGVFRYAGGEGQPIDPVKACNTELTKKLSENADLTKYHVIGKGLNINYPGALTVKYRMYCHATGLGKSDLGSDNTLVNARIECAASDLATAKIPKPKPKPKPARLVSLVKSVDFAADPARHQGKCPVGVKFKGSITANRAGTVRYRYVSHDERTSPTFTMKFDRAGSKATRAWSRSLSKPDTTGQLAMPGGAASKWDHQGWQRLEIIEPRSKKSARAEYKVSCKAPTPARVQKIG